jgi:cytidine deaminase
VPEPTNELTDPEDAKLLTLARASRARAKSGAGAAVRDTDGRTYSAASVDLPSLQLSALQVAVAMAVSSGVTGLAAAVVVSDTLALTPTDVGLVREVAGAGALVAHADGSGTLIDSTTT